MAAETAVTVTPYKTALKAGRKVGAARAEGQPMLALWCDGPLRLLVPASVPEWVYNAAAKRGLTFHDLATMTAADPNAVCDMMWEGAPPL